MLPWDRFSSSILRLRMTSVPDANLWASSDPLFLASVLPHVIVEVMRKLLELDVAPEDGAAFAWSTWASTMMPSSRIPYGRTREEKEKWIDDLVDAFAQRFRLADQVVAKMLETNNDERVPGNISIHA